MNFKFLIIILERSSITLQLSSSSIEILIHLDPQFLGLHRVTLMILKKLSLKDYMKKNDWRLGRRFGDGKILYCIFYDRGFHFFN